MRAPWALYSGDAIKCHKAINRRLSQDCVYALAEIY
jgi:hypothetical protein